MKVLKKWGLPLLTGVGVLSSVLLPRQISAMRDMKLFGKAHTMELSEEDVEIHMPTLSEKLELLGRAIQDPELEVYTTSQQLAGTEAVRQDGTETIGQGETPSEVFAKAMGYLSEWGLLPEGFSLEGMIFGGGSRTVYMELDSGLFLNTLYLQGHSRDMDGLWIVVDEETGLPIWIDCTFRSYGKVLPAPAKAGERFFDGLGVTAESRDGMFVLEDSGGLRYSVSVDRAYGRLCISPAGFGEAASDAEASH